MLDALLCSKFSQRVQNTHTHTGNQLTHWSLFVSYSTCCCSVWGIQSHLSWRGGITAAAESLASYQCPQYYQVHSSFQLILSSISRDKSLRVVGSSLSRAETARFASAFCSVRVILASPVRWTDRGFFHPVLCRVFDDGICERYTDRKFSAVKTWKVRQISGSIVAPAGIVAPIL